MYRKGNGDPADVSDRRIHHGSIVDHMDLSCGISAAAKLQKAARNIKEGNLDFEIKAENDDEIGQLCRDFEEMRLRLKVQAEEKVAFDREIRN